MSNGDSNEGRTTQVGAFGVKKSDFTADTTIPSSATFDYVTNANNIKITFEDLVNNLGVTGTIIAGTESGTQPVLDKAGSVNTIRNLKAGDGIGITQTPQNSLEISTAFTVDSTGAPTFNEATDPTTVRSMVAGDGMSIGFDSGTIQFTVTGAAPVTGKTIQVNSMSDFPDPVAGVITLSDDTFYSINDDLTTSDRFVMGDKTKLGAVGSSIITFEYTGSAVMFTSLDSSNTIQGMTINCSNGTLFDWSDTVSNTNTLTILDCVVICDVLGTFDDGQFLFVEDSQFVCTTNGVLITNSGTTNNLLMSTASFNMTAGTAIDLGTAVIISIRLNTIQMELGGGSTGINGLASSGNVDANGLGRLGGVSFFGAGTAINNILSSDARWIFASCFPVQNSRTDALIFMNGNATNTVITAINTPVLVAGTFTEELASRMTTTAAGRIIYDPESPENLPISVDITMVPAAGPSATLAAYVAVNGAVVAATETRITLASGTAEFSIHTAWQKTFAETDFVEVWVENQTNTNDILVEDITIRVN